MTCDEFYEEVLRAFPERADSLVNMGNMHPRTVYLFGKISFEYYEGDDRPYELSITGEGLGMSISGKTLEECLVKFNKAWESLEAVAFSKSIPRALQILQASKVDNQ